jgi:hypothetical protein
MKHLAPSPAQRAVLSLAISALVISAGSARADDFSAVGPFFKTYCHECHAGETPEADLALDRAAIAGPSPSDYEVWRRVVKMLRDSEMPPAEQPQPMPGEKEKAIAAIKERLAAIDCDDFEEPGRVTIRRLNRLQYNNTIRDLVGVDFQPADDFPADDIGAGFDNIGDVLSISPVLLEKYLEAAEQIIDRAFEDDDLRRRLLPNRLRGEDEAGVARAMRRNVSAFATRAFRRPVAEEELDRLDRLMKAMRDAGASDSDAQRAGLVAVLSSAHFLFRVEIDPPDAGAGDEKRRQLTPYELATRLSYFLWASMPDEDLFAAAARGELEKPEVLAKQVERMLEDPKSQTLVTDFAVQWLGLRELAAMTPDPARFPTFDENLRADMRRETELFVESIVRENRDVLDFLDADYTFLNERLARHYGLEGVRGEEFRRVSLADHGPAGASRRGVLTHASILLLTSNPTRTSPVKRGKWVLDNILGEPPPPPPPGVEELAEDGELLGTLRQRMEQHRSDESCAVCHRQMDTLGFGLENFDAIGAWRESDGRFPIDPAGTLPGGIAFRGPAELMQALRSQRSEDFSRCLAEKLLTYALGRGLTPADRCAVDDILKATEANGRRFQSLVAAIVASEPFRTRPLAGEK